MKIDIEVCHYGPIRGTINFEDTSKIWVCVDDSDDDSFLGSGYIDNPFTIEELSGIEEKFVKKAFSGTLLYSKYMEHSNGGRTNEKVYDSIAEYFADPLVKALVTKRYLSGFDLSSGNPDQLDAIHTFEFDQFPGKQFTVSESLWGDFVPPEWRTEIYASTIEQLDSCVVWDDAKQAIANSEVCDDLFGDRAFPVIRAPKHLAKEMLDIADSAFKSCSKVLHSSEYIYIGLRSKVYELDNINEVYEKGGFILKDRQWDW